MNHEEEKLIDFWSGAMDLSEEDREQLRGESTENWREAAPSEKLCAAAESLGSRKKVLDYGCGTAWAGIIAAKSGCPDVTAVDPAPGAVRTARLYAEHYGVEQRVHADCVPPDWLKSVPDHVYDGFICSNVLDVIPPESAEEILRESARIVTPDAAVVIGLNFHLSPEAAAARGMELEDGRRLYVNGVLRLVSRTDEEWADVFAPWYTVEKLEHFAWPGEAAETRRLFYLRRKPADGPVRAAAADAEAAAVLACGLWPDHTAEEMKAEFESLLAEEDAAVFLYRKDGRPVAFAQCQLRRDYVEGTETSPVGYLEGIYVEEPDRRRGIAKKLLAACEEWAKARGCTEFASDCELSNTESQRFHQAVGFREANRIVAYVRKL